MTTATFRGITLEAAPRRVMTPRPATEALVEAALARIPHDDARVADVGTGSGAVAVAIAVEAPRAEIWATDINADAIALARRNALRQGVADRVHFLHGDLLDGVPADLDLVVANLPYLPSDGGLHTAAPYASEPADAIFAPGDGLCPYRRLASAAGGHLRPDGRLLVQFHRRVFEAPADSLAELPSVLERSLADAA